MYREIALNCFRYLDYKSLVEVDRITIPEYELLMQSVRLKQVDMDYRNHLQAWLDFVARSEKKAGKNKRKPAFRTFREFYDYEKELERAKNGGNVKSRFSDLCKFLRKGE